MPKDRTTEKSHQITAQPQVGRVKGKVFMLQGLVIATHGHRGDVTTNTSLPILFADHSACVSQPVDGFNYRFQDRLGIDVKKKVTGVNLVRSVHQNLTYNHGSPHAHVAHHTFTADSVDTGHSQRSLTCYYLHRR